MKKWYEDNKSQGVNTLLALFGITKERVEFMQLATQFRNESSKATKKNHVHEHREPGSKLLKKHNRYAWDRKNGFV